MNGKLPPASRGGETEPPEELSGGFMNRVVRIGSTVHRSAGPWTPTIHRLLKYARAKNADWIPEPIGFDETGREILSFLPGEVPHEMPDWIWSPAVLDETARRLRQWHDATLGFDTAEAVWNLPPREPREVICHNDFAPYNWVFRKDQFAGAIDFDLSSPGPRLWDIAYTAYRIVPILPPEESRFSIREMIPRLRAFLSSYAGSASSLLYGPEQVFPEVRERLESLAEWTSRHCAETGRKTLAGHPKLYRSHKQWLNGLSAL